MAKRRKEMEDNFDSLFANYVKQAEAEAKRASNRSSFSKNYEEVKYTGLEKGVPSVIRAVGGPVDSKYDPTTAKTVTIARIVGDDGKKFRVIRPSFSEDPNYILNKIISRVKMVKWVNNEKTFPVKDQFPEIWNIIDKNGIQKGDNKYLFDKGWTGKEVIIMNVIDRAQMDWHRQNKHTMLLAKSVSESNGIEYADEGVSSFAIKPQFVKLFKYYGSWEKYDMAITRTGDMNNAFIVENASKTPERVEGPNADYISMEPCLSEEEKSWERYDIEKLFRVTTATKIYNRLKGTIARIDAVLKTNFLTELEAEVEKEKVLFDEIYHSEEEQNEASAVETYQTPMEESVDEVDVPEYKPEPIAPVTRTRVAVAAPGSDLPYYDSLSDDLKKKIISAVKLENGEWDIKWDVPDEQLCKCPDTHCNAVSPIDATKCPSCGMDFC